MGFGIIYLTSIHLLFHWRINLKSKTILSFLVIVENLFDEELSKKENLRMVSLLLRDQVHHWWTWVKTNKGLVEHKGQRVVLRLSFTMWPHSDDEIISKKLQTWCIISSRVQRHVWQVGQFFPKLVRQRQINLPCYAYPMFN